MPFYKSIFLIIIAGIMNGSFVIPLRYLQHISEERAWFYYSIIGIFILPWVFLLSFLPNIIHIYIRLHIFSLMLILVSGFIFGGAQICFSQAIKKIGFPLAFPINIGVGIILGSMFFVFFNHALFSRHGFVVVLSVSCVLLGLCLSYFSGKRTCLSAHGKHYYIGWLLSFLAGIAGGFQNISFITVAFYSKIFFVGLNSFWVWPLFLSAASIPMILGFYVKSDRNRFYQMKEPINKFSIFKNFFLIMVMSLCFTGSLWFYSLGMQNLSGNDVIIGWPIFMTFIILTSQFWGVICKESKFSFFGFIFLLVAVLLLGFF